MEPMSGIIPYLKIIISFVIVVCEKSEPPLINGVTSNGDTMGNLSNSTEDTMSEIMEQGILNQEKEKKFVDDCMCKLCYDGDCCLTSYLHSPLRKLWHNARYQTNRFIDNKYFEGTILFLIGFSSITLVRAFYIIFCIFNSTFIIPSGNS